MTAPFRVLITCDFFEPGFRGGGPVRSVAHLLDTMSGDIDAVLVTRDRDAGDTAAYPGLSGRWVARGPSRIFYLDAGRLRHWIRLWSGLRSGAFDILYVNSFWTPVFTLLPILAVRVGLLRARGVLIAPRGEFSPGALAIKAVRKRVFRMLWEPVLRGLPVRWHASTGREADEIRRVFPGADIEISLNQVTLPYEPLVPAGGGPVTSLTYISRISVKKGLATALAALREVEQPLDFDIYGPVEDPDYWASCRALIERLPPWINARYRGELTPDRVRDTFARYDAFVLPTFGENFGHVIAESLSASCPVICSDQTPWTALLGGGGGSAVPAGDVRALASELRRYAGMPPADRLRARETAGHVYRRWRAEITNPNVLDRVRMATSAKRGD